MSAAAAPKVVKVKGPKDLTAKIIGKLQLGRPKDRNCTYEVTRSTTAILSKVKYVLKTGIEAYDAATGIGGLPFGRIVEVYGLDGACKSAMALRCAVRLQERHIYEVVRTEDRGAAPVLKRVADNVPVFTIYIDNEQSIDEDGKTKIDGVELDVAVARCDTVDQMFKIIDTAIDGVQEVVEETGVECFIQVIVDTIAGTSSREEMDAKWEDVDYSRQPKQLREGFRCLTRKLSRRNVLVVCTNQVSDSYKKKLYANNSSIPQDADFNTFGGKALKYYASLRIFQYKLNVNYKLDKKQQFPSGMTIGFQVTKNRMGKPWRTGRMVLLFEGGLNDIFSKLETLLHLNLGEWVEGGSYMFRFRSAGVVTTTFPEEERAKNPRLTSLAEWPAFYEAHRADFDLLWKRGLEVMFQESTIPDGVESDADVDED